MLKENSFDSKNNEGFEFFDCSVKANIILKEYLDLVNNPIKGAIFHFNKKYPLEWIFLIEGSQQTPYQGGVFILKCLISKEYPSKAPKILMRTNIYHPLIELETNEMCQTFINFKWMQIQNIRMLIISFLCSLVDPRGTIWLIDSLNTVTKKCLQNHKEFVKIATEWTQKYAKGELFKILKEKKKILMISFNLKNKLFKKVFNRHAIIEDIIFNFL